MVKGLGCLNMTPEPPEKGECEEDTSLKSPLYQKKRPMSSHDKYLIFNVFSFFSKFSEKVLFNRHLKFRKFALEK